MYVYNIYAYGYTDAYTSPYIVWILYTDKTAYDEGEGK